MAYGCCSKLEETGYVILLLKEEPLSKKLGDSSLLMLVAEFSNAYTRDNLVGIFFGLELVRFLAFTGLLYSEAPSVEAIGLFVPHELC